MRALIAASLAASALGFGIFAGQGCMLLTGDGDYKVGPRGLGEPCTSDLGCVSNNCACDPAMCDGWCTNTCNASTDCAGDYPGGATLKGQRNFCVTNAAAVASNTCFPGCSATPDCAAFSGTVCEPATTADNTPAHICTLPTGDGGI
jgi:hypothetical protein